MATNLPKSRNRNLPQPPAEPADVRPRPPVMTPVQQAPVMEEPSRGATALRSFFAMLVVGGLLFAGIFFYIRGSESDSKKRDLVIGNLALVGKQVWDLQGRVDLPAETEDRKKDLADLPRIFGAATAMVSQKGAPRIVVIEGDPAPGRGNATHQIQYFFRDTVQIILHIYYDVKDETILFIGVHNRLVPDRDDYEREQREREEKTGAAPALNTLPPAGDKPPVPPATATPQEGTPPQTPPSPAEKVSVPPANPR